VGPMFFFWGGGGEEQYFSDKHNFLIPRKNREVRKGEVKNRLGEK
jgi:hypothetical protein